MEKAYGKIIHNILDVYGTLTDPSVIYLDNGCRNPGYRLLSCGAAYGYPSKTTNNGGHPHNHGIAVNAGSAPFSGIYSFQFGPSWFQSRNLC
jgi:hypothetical protein